MKLSIAEINKLPLNTKVEGALFVKASNVDYVKKFVSMKLSDGELEIDAKMWKSVDAPEKGSVIDIKAATNEYNDVRNIIVNSYTPSDLGRMEFVNPGPVGIDSLKSSFEKLLSSIEHEDLCSFVMRCYEPILGNITSCPAAVGHHHVYPTGTFHHTIEVTELARYSALVMGKYRSCSANVDLVIAGALLHDIGKYYCYTYNDGVPEMTDLGKNLDHIAVGQRVLDRTAIELGLIDKTWYSDLLHIVLAHHGKLEYGSPVAPNSVEAYIVSEADMISSQVQAMQSEIDKLNVMDMEWSDKKSFKFGTFLHARKEL